MSKEITEGMSGEFGRLVVSGVKRAFLDGAARSGVRLNIIDGPRGFLSSTVPVRFEWTGSREAVKSMTSAAMEYCSRLLSL